MILNPALCWFQAQHFITSHWKSCLGHDISGKIGCSDILAPKTWRLFGARLTKQQQMQPWELSDASNSGKKFPQSLLWCVSIIGRNHPPLSCQVSVSHRGCIDALAFIWTLGFSWEFTFGSCWVCLPFTVKEKNKAPVQTSDMLAAYARCGHQRKL